MNRIRSEKFALFLLVCSFVFTTNIFAQTAEVPTKNVNFRYSQNPKIRTKPEVSNEQSEQNAELTSIAAKTLEIARKNNTVAMSPTEIYKVGNGDILFINLQNAPRSSTYYTVLNDGTIDYALAGEMVSVVGLTTDEIGELLKEKVKLYDNPQISVTVREYASHTISVLGLVEKAGEKKIQREAVPLFVIRAEAVVSPSATQAVIRRSDASVETINLSDVKSESVLIFPNDIVEFVSGSSSRSAATAQFYFIGGNVISGGQKDFHDGITLTQAIFAAGGTKVSGLKRAIVRRKNAEGMLFGREYDMKKITDGKEADPVLEAGDTIEIPN